MIKSITSVKVSNRRVLLRAGFDVPLQKNIHSEELEIVEDARIKDALATLRYLIDEGAKIILISHLNRPKGWEQEKSLWPAAKALADLLNYKLVKISDKLPDYDATPHLYFLTKDITKNDYSGLGSKIKPGEILFLENLRFYDGEEKNSEAFVKVLERFADIYVNEAFSVSHRNEASITGIAGKLNSYAGISLLNEIKALDKVNKPQHPLVVIMGGAKIADKVETINNLAIKAENILIGGAIANSFLKAKGYQIGKSKFADFEHAKKLLRDFKEKIVLPVDVVIAKSSDGVPSCVKIEKVKTSDSIFDIGPETIRKFAEYIKDAKTLVWNGPMGYIENPRFAFGSKSIARTFAARSKGHAFGVAGGGETLEVIDMAHVSEFIDHVSSGGGAMLDYLAGKELPGLKALKSNG